MKKIVKVEDIISYELPNEYCVSGDMQKNGFLALPYDDPADGVFGYIVFEKENDENSLICTSKVYDTCEQIFCDSGEEFIGFLKESLNCNYPTFVCDNPKTLKKGFVSLRNDVNKHYSIGISGFKDLKRIVLKKIVK